MIRSGRLKTLILVLALMCVTPVGADYEAGQRAWDAGQRDAASSSW